LAYVLSITAFRSWLPVVTYSSKLILFLFIQKFFTLFIL